MCMPSDQSWSRLTNGGGVLLPMLSNLRQWIVNDDSSYGQCVSKSAVTLFYVFLISNIKTFFFFLGSWVINEIHMFT